MTSSLVGSEMCIRDRCKTVHCQKAIVHRAARCMLVNSAAPQHSLLALAPVSYTHLTLPTICSV
eukprot:7256076-Prorocentrum_lima.AAC.1